MRRWSLKFSELIAAGHWRTYVSVLVLFSLLVMVFYSTPLREQMEFLLYDLRTTIKPEREPADRLVVIGIPDYASKLETDKSQSEQSKIAYSDLLAALQIVSSSKASLIGAILFPSIFDYESSDAGLFAVSVAGNPRVLVGTMGLDTEYPSVRKTPNQFSLISDRLFGLETFRARRHQTIRRMPYNGYRGMTPVMLFPLAVSSRLKGEFFKSTILRKLSATNWQVQWFPLNYVRPSKVPQLDFEELHMLNAAERDRLLDGKVVLIAPLYYRERPINNDQIFANTPWQREGEDPMFGTSLTWIQANGILNLLNDRTLKEPSHSVIWVVVQTIFMAIWCGLIWQWGIAIAVLCLIGGWTVFLYAHAVAMAELSLIIPVSDTVLFSSVATMLGCLWRIQHENILKAKERISTEARREVARVQSRFLDNFSTELLDTNKQIMECADRLKGDHPGLDSDLLNRFEMSGQEFDEYLRSIRDFAGLSAEQVRHARKDWINLRVLIDRVVKHFELKCQAEDIHFKVQVSEQITVRSDERMLDAIIFNFISNAVKYSPKGGEIRVSTENRGRRRVVLSVADQGQGIAAEFQERIFEKFYRVRDDRNVAIKGNGLGLYLCKYFADLIGGEIQLKSEIGRGSTFSLELKV